MKLQRSDATAAMLREQRGNQGHPGSGKGPLYGVILLPFTPEEANGFPENQPNAREMHGSHAAITRAFDLPKEALSGNVRIFRNVASEDLPASLQGHVLAELGMPSRILPAGVRQQARKLRQRMRQTLLHTALLVKAYGQK